jgi:hypothetical protein
MDSEKKTAVSPEMFKLRQRQLVDALRDNYERAFDYLLATNKKLEETIKALQDATAKKTKK